MTDKSKKPSTTLTLDNLPDQYIKAKYLRPTGRIINMAGFDAGEPEVAMITSRLGKRTVRITLNGYIQIQPNGDVLILDTPFNRSKLRILCGEQTERMPKDSTGKEYTIKQKGPDFAVEDESIFEGLDEALEKLAKKAPKLPRGNGKSLVPASDVTAGKGVPEDNAAGVGGGERRPEMTDLDLA